MSDFKWGDPPARPGGRYKQSLDLARKLASRPGKWARIKNYKSEATARSYATKIRQGKVKGFTDTGKFEVMVRQTTDGYDVWCKCTSVNRNVTIQGEPE